MRLSTQPDDEEARGRRDVMVLAGGVLAVGLIVLSRLHLNRPNSWPAIVGVTALFFAGEVMPVSIEFRRESHTFTFTSVPFTLGLFFLSPPLLVLCRLASSVITLGVLRRQPPFRLVTNVATHLIEVVTIAGVVQLADPDLHLGPTGWLALAAAVLAADLVGALVVTAAISVYQHRFEPSLLGGLGFGVLSTLADMTLALVVITLVKLHQPAAWLMVGVGAFIVLLLRALSTVTARHRQVERLYELNKELGEAVLAGEVIPVLLARTTEVLHAETAWILRRSPAGSHRIVVVDGEPHHDDIQPIDALILDRLDADPNPFLLGALEHGSIELARDGHTEAIAARLPSADPANAMALVIADRSGSVRPFDSDDVTLFGTLALHAAVALRNVEFVDRLQTESARNEHLATHDSLTGLANREVIEQAIDSLLADRAQVAVLLIDLDRFKDVNDTLGHNNGDLLLIEAGRRMTEVVGEDDLIARLGGDEFAIIVRSAATPEQLGRLADRLLAELRRPYVVADVDVEISASIGIATPEGPDADAIGLLRHADVAMYAAKSDQVGMQFYRAERDHYSPRRLALVAQLRAAIDRCELEVHYQPLIELATGELRGAEALVRWPTPDGGMIMPDEFIGVAEHTGLIRTLSRYVIRQTVDQGSRWWRQGRELRLSINLSPRNLIEADLPSELARYLRTYGLPPDALQLEVTETTVMSDPLRMIDVLQRFRETGVGIAIDDFGTGHSSLSYLTRLPATELKVDKSFVAAMATDPASRTVVRSIVELGHSLGLEVLAEGIESLDVADDLRAMGCELGQGYLFSRALPADDFRAWMDRHARPEQQGAVAPLPAIVARSHDT